MKLHFKGVAWILFCLSTFLWILLTMFESSLVGMSPTTERVITFFLLVFPTLLGTAFGMLSLVRREEGAWLAMSAVLLNAAFALFQLLILAFAG